MRNEHFFDALPPHLIHSILTYYGNWLHGDERGFRSRDHRIHSSGDYRNPPPSGEHEGLLRHVIRSMGRDAVVLNPAERKTLGAAFLEKTQRMGFETYAVAACSKHLHVLYRGNENDALEYLGRAKQFASLRLKTRPGPLWAAGGKVIRVTTLAHANAAFPYVCDHEEKEGAWVWRADEDGA